MSAVAVSKHPLATRAGLATLEQGGNAFDALVTMGFVLAVVEPYMSGIGGGKYQLVAKLSDGELVAIDAPVVAPLAATEGCFDVDPRMPRGLFGFSGVRDRANEIGTRSVAVPGVLAGLELTRRRFGTLSLEAAMAPAIARASEGHALSWLDIGYIAASAPVLARDPASASIFLADGGVPAPAIQHRIEPAPRLVQTELASSLALIAREGVDVFYRGELGERVAAHLSAQGGWLAPEDLARYRARQAVVTEIGYRGFRIATGSDTEVLEALLILERFDLRALGHNSAAALHIIAEACRLAHADFYRYMTAPEGGPPAAAALEKAHIDALAARIRTDGAIEARLFPDEAEGPAPPGAASTTTSYLAADAAGNLAAALQTHGHVFGSGVTVPGTGVLLNDQMMGYNPEPGTRASVGPGRERPTSGWPVLVTTPDGECFAFAAPGGNRVLCALTQAVVNVVDFGLDVQAALAAPRIDCGSTPVARRLVICDARIPSATLRGLEDLGHAVEQASGHLATPAGAPMSFAAPAGVHVPGAARPSAGGNDPDVPGGVAAS